MASLESRFKQRIDEVLQYFRQSFQQVYTWISNQMIQIQRVLQQKGKEVCHEFLPDISNKPP